MEREKISIEHHISGTIIRAIRGSSLFQKMKRDSGESGNQPLLIEGKEPHMIAERLKKVASRMHIGVRLYHRKGSDDFTALLWDRTPEKKNPAYRKGWINNIKELGIEAGVPEHPNISIVDISRIIYKNTACGAYVVGLEDEEDNKTIGVSVGSIVEGVDYGTSERDLKFPFTKRMFWDTVNEIELEANEIWHDTHGCEICAVHWFNEGVNPSKKWEPGATQCWPECPACKGHGVII